MEIILSICIGISLAAAVGFRIFVPLLVMSIASLTGHLNLSSGFGMTVWKDMTTGFFTTSKNFIK